MEYYYWVQQKWCSDKQLESEYAGWVVAQAYNPS
jgi:hypothetical protein